MAKEENIEEVKDFLIVSEEVLGKVISGLKDLEAAECCKLKIQNYHLN
jgi:hypothetical protein